MRSIHVLLLKKRRTLRSASTHPPCPCELALLALPALPALPAPKAERKRESRHRRFRSPTGR
jgi:hypothetical protein